MSENEWKRLIIAKKDWFCSFCGNPMPTLSSRPASTSRSLELIPISPSPPSTSAFQQTQPIDDEQPYPGYFVLEKIVDHSGRKPNGRFCVAGTTMVLMRTLGSQKMSWRDALRWCTLSMKDRERDLCAPFDGQNRYDSGHPLFIPNESAPADGRPRVRGLTRWPC